MIGSRRGHHGALPGLRRRRPHRLHRARPRAGRTGSSSTCSAASTCTPSARSGTTSTTGWPSTSTSHPRAVMARTAFFRCGEQAIFEVFQYSAPDQRTPTCRATATSAATTSRCTSRTWTPPWRTCASTGVTVLGEPDRQHGVRPRAAVGLLPAPWGMQFELVSYPGGKAFDRRAERPRDRRRRRPGGQRAGRGAPARGDPGRRDRARASGSARRRSPSGSAPAGCRCARRCGCWRPRGSPSTSANKGARVPRLDQHEVDVLYQMRERLEPLALTESLAAPAGRSTSSGWRRCSGGSRPNDDLDEFLALDREFHLLTYSRLPPSSS